MGNAVHNEVPVKLEICHIEECSANEEEEIVPEAKSAVK